MDRESTAIVALLAFLLFIGLVGAFDERGDDTDIPFPPAPPADGVLHLQFVNNSPAGAVFEVGLYGPGAEPGAHQRLEWRSFEMREHGWLASADAEMRCPGDAVAFQVVLKSDGYEEMDRVAHPMHCDGGSGRVWVTATKYWEVEVRS